MSITVRIDGDGPDSFIHLDGRYTDIDSRGNLGVYSANGDEIAIYHFGHWISARFEPDVVTEETS